MLQKLVALLVIRPLLPVNAPDSWREVDLCTVVFASTYVACWPDIVLQTCTISGLSFKADEQVRRTSHLDPKQLVGCTGVIPNKCGKLKHVLHNVQAAPTGLLSPRSG